MRGLCLYYTFSGCGRVGIFLQDRWLQCRDMKMNVHLLLFLVGVSITPALLSTTKPKPSKSDSSSSSAAVPSSEVSSEVSSPAVTATPTLVVFSIMITSEVSTFLTTGAPFPTTMPPHTSEATHSTTAQSPPTLSSTEVSTPSKSVPSSGSISLTTGPMPPVSSTTGPSPHVSSSQTTGPASSSPEIHPSSKNVPSSSEPHSPSPYPSHCPPQVSDDCDCSDYMRKLYIVVGTTIPASILLTMLAMVPLCWCCQKTKKKGTYIRMAPTVYFDEDDN